VTLLSAAPRRRVAISPIPALACALVVGALSPARATLAGQAPAAAVDSLPGRTLVRVRADGADSTQTFAVYLPSGYPGDHRWAALFVMDPRGRGRLGLDLFAPAAERYGFVVISSYNTLSDGPVEPNVGAINAMLSAAQSSLAVDLGRLYIAGFSGTARVGWEFETEAPNNFAGLLGAGAAPILTDSTATLLRQPGFALALTAGSADFNWAEVRGTEQRLVREGTPVQADYFAGPHRWPPAPLIDRALAWFRLRGMLAGRWETDTAWVAAEIGARWHEVDSLEQAGQPARAADRLAELALTLAGRPEADRAARRAHDLEQRAEVSAFRDRAAELAKEEGARVQAVGSVLVDVRRADRRVDPEELVRRLDVAGLKRLAAEGDSLQRPVAERVLAFEAVYLGFYEPRRYLERQQPGRAVAALEAYRAMAPWGPQHCAFLAEARSALPEAERPAVPVCPIRDSAGVR
jgi:predicted esterase